MSDPLISIITVVFNHKDLLERTISSVGRQTYKNIEYVVIDGGSTDGTCDVIRKYESEIAYWVSEPDKGLYDAMNKGMRAATGNYVWFINAGDEIYQSGTLEQLIQQSSGAADVYYGETELIDPSGFPLGVRSRLTTHALPETLTWMDMSKGMAVCHQSFMARKEIAPYFDPKYPYCADVDWIIKSLKNSREVVNTHMILSKFLVGGFSRRLHSKSLMDRYRILQHHFGVITNIKNHLAIGLRAIKKRSI